MDRTAGSFVTGIIIIAVLFVLVRPGSKGPDLVKNVGGALSGLLQSATGGGTWADTTGKKKA